MAVKLVPREVDSRLFCISKFFGDPDMPADMPYPMMTYSVEGEEYEYPLTFICQIDCSDISEYVESGHFPEEGMLYFFAAIDPYLGYDAPGCGVGEWPKGASVVKYTKQVNPETFESYEMLDEQGEGLSQAPWAIDFERCDDNDDCIRMFGTPEELLHLVSSHELGLDFMEASSLNFMISEKDLGFSNWKKHKVELK